MRQPAILVAFAACCALPASLQAAPSSGQTFLLDAANRQALVKLPFAPGADAAAARLVVVLSSVEAPPGAFAYIRITALCEGGREAWHAAISPFPPDQAGRFLHGLRDPGAAACTPDQLMLRLEWPAGLENERLPTIKGYVAVE